MNNIHLRQNEAKQIERLAAQRELYSSAKRYYGLRIILTVIIPVVFAIVAIAYPGLLVVASIYGLVIFVVDIAILESFIGRMKLKAAKIQEMFDCYVLDIPVSPLKAVNDVTIEEVLRNHDAYIKIPTNVEKIRNWYPVKVEKLPVEIARLICQRCNCWWDGNLRENYANLLKFIMLAVSIISLIIGIVTKMTLIDMLLLYSGLVPFYQFGLTEADKNSKASLKLKDLLMYVENTWGMAMIGVLSSEQMVIESRRLQDEIFNHRSQAPLLLDFYYKVFRGRNEELMNRTVDSLIDEALERLGISKS